VPLQLQPTDRTQELTIRLRRGVTLRGRVVGQDGKPVASALLLAPTHVPHGLEVRGDTLPVRAGRFELPGCAPGGKVTVRCYNARKKEGAVAALTARPGAGPVVRLAPCVSAGLRLMDRAGAPVARPRLMTELVLRPGDTVNQSLQKGTEAGI